MHTALAVLAAVSVVYGLSYLVRRPLPVFHTYRQVPKVWREVFSPRTAALLYGLGLGLGFFTRVPYVTFYVAVGVSFAAGSPLAGALAGATFGLARALPLVAFRFRERSFERVAEADILFSWRPLIQGANGTVLVATGIVLVGLSV